MQLHYTSWRPAPLLVMSILLHAGAVTAVLVQTSAWPWALAAVMGNHALLTGLSLWPRDRLLGPNLTRLPAAAAARGAIALTIDDGPDPEVTPQVLDLLDAHGVRATFFVIGARVARHPELARDIVRRGHALENHTQHHWWHFSLLGVGSLAREIATAQETIADVTGQVPQYFRAPAGLRSPLLDPALHRVGLRLTSWTRRGFDTVERNADKVCGKLLSGLAGGDILLLHDGHAARTTAGVPVILAVLPPLLAAIRSAGLTPVTLRAPLP